jgi:DMSO/TMAO reductase YedYZ molybdopterin-dependent catalytic subunit
MSENRIAFWKVALGGLSAGLSGGIMMLLVAGLLRLLLGSPSATELIFDRAFPLVSIDFFVEQINRFGGYTQLKVAGVIASLVGQILASGLAGLTYALLLESLRRRHKGESSPPRPLIDPIGWKLIVFGLLLVWLGFEIFLAPTLITQYRGVPTALSPYLTSLGLLVEFAACAFGILLFYGLLTHRRASVTDNNSLLAGHRTRRAFLQLATTAAGAVAFSFIFRRLTRKSSLDYDGMTYEGPDVQSITPNDDFYSVTKNLVDPEVDGDLWRLEMTGAVEQPRTYSFGELTAMPAIEQLTTLCCISYPVGGGLMSNALWKGVPLPRVLEASRPKSNVKAILFHAADGYYETFPFSKATEPTTLLAYEMNGEPLPRIHGFPLRLIVPGLYGEKNPKWLTKIELLTGDDPRLKKTHGCGFYKEQGWGPNFVVPTHSRIDAPAVQDGKFVREFRTGTSVDLGGIAFGGDRGIQKVELSFDKEKSWQEATIVDPGTKISWSLWNYRWVPPASGQYAVAVRATDGTGALQISEDRGTIPQGSTGLHRVLAAVT